MAGEALQCSYVVLSVGRYLDPALAVRNLDPELPPPHKKSGVFFACDPAYSASSLPLSANSIQSASTV
ncbi:hypothetical protein SAMN03159306_03550 [Pseudomonas sp. NFACC48-1]|nr:hypothetical protein SAMN03159424_04198 [Pseudomonas sp. NFACC05-1]SCZ42282.1 hypothetical protein SAMN03159405_04739 [Pseudomonas sp. NFACC44-2]SDA78088.1 hypothetical protein SAMN03159429_03847 [Pseudomonas sp. NFACC51]SDW04397.1 hypothetical protein SAMN03159474_00097 [Pseudomonas sp. NFACC08-1]SEK01408.1 hypothetical protein SAMN03159298_05761 [Pseudomonas sp. NFACC07-1]SFI39256.1 hypothetical protein SAMN03159302_04020 [Pseudomonas sp. NFACC54]SFT08073.1 hypothetical protein SAMN03159